MVASAEGRTSSTSPWVTRKNGVFVLPTSNSTCPGFVGRSLP
jgi:hypothetical protein